MCPSLGVGAHGAVFDCFDGCGLTPTTAVAGCFCCVFFVLLTTRDDRAHHDLLRLRLRLHARPAPGTDPSVFRPPGGLVGQSGLLWGSPFLTFSVFWVAVWFLPVFFSPFRVCGFPSAPPSPPSPPAFVVLCSCILRLSCT